MLYINRSILSDLGIRWDEQAEVIRSALRAIRAKDIVQPVKPYLRYRNMINRIIAMPAYVGGEMEMAGIKWIASFPGNAEKGLHRAHSVTVLNEANTGVPLCIFNTALISGIRTATVSSVLLEVYLRKHPAGSRLRAGITGFGPIGQLHLQMLMHVACDYDLDIRLYDLKGIGPDCIPDGLQDRVTLCNSWEEAYREADIFITCTVAGNPYIDLAPKPGSLQMNVSLRDYQPEYRKWAGTVIVDDWDEVCRENTDIENMYRKGLLQREDTISLADAVCDDLLALRPPDDVVMFNPMGMAVFDIAVAQHYYQLAIREKKGLLLED